ncbi:MAG: histidine--tRNA ligase [Rickettsiales bacterium]|jgi:histidyl-tRNA synthetase|nr:histidine--tRNA ligase [Rickettsiales bacterium]
MNLQPVRGTRDLFGEDINKYNHVVEVAREISLAYNFTELMTPIFEFSEVFERNLGDTSDIVLKEIYKFKDRSDNYLSLRPEFTAGVVRALLNNSELGDRLPIKLFSHGPIFRYDRPQKGRYRQFSQVNFECFGIDGYMGDVDMILMCRRFLESLGVDNLTLEINSLGSEESRESFENSLGKYLEKYKGDLSEDSKIRLEKNILRILDSKDERDRKILENAPRIGAHYTMEDRKFFSSILEKLSLMGVKYEINESLVRGLDYYTSTVFEFIPGKLAADRLGAQSTVMAGGRYDRLVGQMSNRNVPAVGCAAGVERLMLLMEEQQLGLELISVIPVSDGELDHCLELVERLRSRGIACELNSHGSIRKKMTLANRSHSKYTIIVGTEEIGTGTLTLKDMETGIEEKLDPSSLLEKLSPLLEL